MPTRQSQFKFIFHSYLDMLRQRVFGLFCGYEDCNDAARLTADSVHRMLQNRDPKYGDELAFQPTLSRFENAIDVRSLDRMVDALADLVVRRHRKRLGKKVKRITIDMYPTNDPTYGQQQLTIYNSHYGNWCYLPVAGYLQFDDEPDRYFFCYVLRPDDSHATYGAVWILKHIIAKLRKIFPGTLIQVRLDGGYAAPEVFQFLEQEGVGYVIGLAKNNVLKEEAEPLLEEANWASYYSGNT